MKLTFSSVFIKEKVYIEQLPSFENLKFPNHAFKLKKVLYCLKHVPHDWNKRLSNFLVSKDFEREQINPT